MNSVPREYNIALRSSTSTQITPLNSVDYNFDWSALPDVPYQLSFTFQSNSFAIGLSLSKAVITTDLFLPNNYQAETDLQVASSSGILGLLKSGFIVNAQTYLQCDKNSNPITILSSRPRQNTFNISVRRVDGTTLEANFDTYDYILILHLKEIV